LVYMLKQDFQQEELRAPDSDAEWDTPETTELLLSGILEAGFEPVDVGAPNKLLEPSFTSTVDLVLSTCEMQGYRFRESIVPTICEFLHIPYALSPPDSFMVSLDKNLCNLVMRQAGGRVPDWHFVREASDLARNSLNAFPYIVKPSAEGSGMGICDQAVVDDIDSLTDVVAQVIAVYRQPALVQTFMPGREFSVGLVERGGKLECLHPLEVVPRVRNPRFVYDYRTKTHKDDLIDHVPLRGEGDLHSALLAEAVRAFAAIDCRDLARVDLRLSADGDPHFLEINPAPEMHPKKSSLARSARAAGLSYEELLRTFLENAAKRWGLAKGAVSV